MSDKKHDNEKDYGYYGKGLEGYTHYKQDFDRNFNHSLGNNYGCLDWLLLLLVPITCLIVVLVGGLILYIFCNLFLPPL